MDLSITEKIACPLCNKDVPRRNHTIDRWTIVQCTACAFVYVNPRLPKTALYRLYTDNYFDNTEVGYYHYTENKELRKQNFTKWVKDAQPYLDLPSSKKALDVGCAAGYCLEVFAELGWQPAGIELDVTLAEEVRSKGFPVFDTPLLSLSTTETYSIITLFDVIEHLTDLHQNMQKLSSLLEENGLLVLVTPDYESWQRKIFGKRWFQFKPVEHINYFSPSSLEQLAHANGFRVLACKRSGQFCDASFLENRLRKYNLTLFLPPFQLLRRLVRGRRKSVYLDTASLYAILQKRGAGKEVATPPLQTASSAKVSA